MGNIIENLTAKQAEISIRSRWRTKRAERRKNIEFSVVGSTYIYKVVSGFLLESW